MVLLLIDCLLLLLLFEVVLYLGLVLLFSTVCPSSAATLMWKLEFVALPYFNYLPVVCSDALPPGAVGWSAMCDCDIAWSYSLTFWSFFYPDSEYLRMHGLVCTFVVRMQPDVYPPRYINNDAKVCW